MFGNKSKAILEEPVGRDKCRHYWVIESAKGPISRGVCKFCGMEKEFKNYLTDLPWWDSDTFSPSRPFHRGQNGELEVEGAV